MNLISLAEAGWIPDAMIRFGIRRLLASRLQQLQHKGEEAQQFARRLAHAPAAVETDAANQQHYEVPAEFFQAVLGPRLKYSCCLFPQPGASLADAETAMLRLTCQRAQLEDGQRILELGCGWGSLTLWMAEHFPGSEVTAVSNSTSQRLFIEQAARRRGLSNVRVVTADMRGFDATDLYDRIVSVEMLEHMRNYRLLFQRIADWLLPDGRLFVHVFCHRRWPYLFEANNSRDWMARHFFTGGTMPSEALFSCFGEHLALTRQWSIDGLHYWQTCEAWLQNLDRHRRAIQNRFAVDMPAAEAARQVQRWRMFLLACAELFRYGGGRQWRVAHYLFEKAPVARSAGVGSREKVGQG